MTRLIKFKKGFDLGLPENEPGLDSHKVSISIEKAHYSLSSHEFSQ